MAIFNQPFLSGGFPSMNRAVPFGEGWTFADDFSTYANQTAADAVWVPRDGTYSQVNVTNDEIDFDMVYSPSIHAHVVSSQTISDTAFLLRWRMNFSVADANTPIMFVGVSTQDETGTSATACDSLSWEFNNQVTSDDRSSAYSEGASMYNNQSGFTDVIGTSTDYWFEIKRTSSTSATWREFDSADYDTTVHDITRTIASTIDNMSYIVLKNLDWDSSTSLTFTGIADEFYFNNGTSSPP